MRYELISIGNYMYLVFDTVDNCRKWITEDEMLQDIFNDPLMNIE